MVAAFFLVSAETYLATHARGVFKMAFIGVGPTELRILLAAGAIALINTPTVDLFGLGPVRLWDLGGVIGAIGMGVHVHRVVERKTRALYLEETRRVDDSVAASTAQGFCDSRRRAPADSSSRSPSSALLANVPGVHYLVATAIGVEAAILTNFLWHDRWTWRDRPARAAAIDC